MAAVPITFHGTMYPKDHSVKPYAFTAMGMAEITGLEVGGGPILPPDQVPPVQPPLVIWGGPFDPPHPEHPIVLPDPITPPDQPPSPIPPPHAGWNFNDGQNPAYPNAGWYYLWIPGPTDPGPRRR